MIRK
jgi:hypothetical protein